MANFMRKGITKIWWVPSIASGSLIPTTAEVNAGTHLTAAGKIASLKGFSFANNPIDIPDMSQAFVPKISGADQSDDSSIEFYEDKVSNPIYSALVKGTAGYIVIFPKGIAGATPNTGDICDVWPQEIGSRARQYSADNAAAMYLIAFTPTAAPGFDKTVT